MGKIYQNIEELIGRTPLLEVAGIEKELGPLGLRRRAHSACS